MATPVPASPAPPLRPRRWPPRSRSRCTGVSLVVPLYARSTSPPTRSPERPPRVREQRVPFVHPAARQRERRERDPAEPRPDARTRAVFEVGAFDPVATRTPAAAPHHAPAERNQASPVEISHSSPTSSARPDAEAGAEREQRIEHARIGRVARALEAVGEVAAEDRAVDGEHGAPRRAEPGRVHVLEARAADAPRLFARSGAAARDVGASRSRSMTRPRTATSSAFTVSTRTRSCRLPGRDRDDAQDERAAPRGLEPRADDPRPVPFAARASRSSSRMWPDVGPGSATSRAKPRSSTASRRVASSSCARGSRGRARGWSGVERQRARLVARRRERRPDDDGAVPLRLTRAGSPRRGSATRAKQASGPRRREAHPRRRARRTRAHTRADGAWQNASLPRAPQNITTPLIEKSTNGRVVRAEALAGQIDHVAVVRVGGAGRNLLVGPLERQARTGRVRARSGSGCRRRRR